MSELNISINDQSVEAADEVIFNVKSNPKREGSKAHARFTRYIGAATVADYLEAGGTKGDLKYDWEKGFLDITDVMRDE